MKIFSRFLQIAFFLTAFLSSSVLLGITLSNGDMRYFPTIEWIIPLLAIEHALIFGKMSRGELLRPYQLFNWIFAGVFFAAHTIIFYAYFSHESVSFIEICKNLVQLFTPELRSEWAIRWLSTLYVKFIHYGTPVISVVSFTAFGITCFNKCMRTEEAESGPGE